MTLQHQQITMTMTNKEQGAEVANVGTVEFTLTRKKQKSSEKCLRVVRVEEKEKQTVAQPPNPSQRLKIIFG